MTNRDLLIHNGYEDITVFENPYCDSFCCGTNGNYAMFEPTDDR